MLALSTVALVVFHELAARTGVITGKGLVALVRERYGRLAATLCVYMGMKNLETITRRLQAGGMAPDTPAAVIQSATTENHRQLISTVSRIALESEHAGFGAPSIVVIGAVALLSEQLNWFAARAESLVP